MNRVRKAKEEVYKRSSKKLLRNNIKRDTEFQIFSMLVSDKKFNLG